MAIIVKNPLFLRIDREIHAILVEMQMLGYARDYLQTPDMRVTADASRLYPIIVAGTASTIEKVYSGMERCLKMLAQDIDGYVPSGDSWHRDLLVQVAHPVPGIRDIPIISEDTLQALTVLKDFRHRERNLYGSDLVVDRVIDLAGKAQNGLEKLNRDLEIFGRRIGAIVEKSPPSSGPCM
ncbi:hypothetical protein ACJU26_05885 [Acidithiobacillus sp. M4-SHS-6]|uniref:ribonuclease toxin HepT-like protein n=1 Tax=Acidithiobacillus sp. M4-SHS-6 TaxID=3383024 RepID=UPI0039BE83FC